VFVDASAIIAVLTGEPEADMLANQLDSARAPITSPVAVFEATLGLCRKTHASVAEASADVREFLDAARIHIVPLTEREAETALDASARYGKGRGHPARLNMGDCFAYAMAKNHQVPLLFKGDNFSKTDIPSGSSTGAA